MSHLIISIALFLDLYDSILPRCVRFCFAYVPFSGNRSQTQETLSAARFSVLTSMLLSGVNLRRESQGQVGLGSVLCVRPESIRASNSVSSLHQPQSERDGESTVMNSLDNRGRRSGPMWYVFGAIIVGSVGFAFHKVRSKRKAEEFGVPHSFLFR